MRPTRDEEAKDERKRDKEQRAAKYVGLRVVRQAVPEGAHLASRLVGRLGHFSYVASCRVDALVDAVLDFIDAAMHGVGNFVGKSQVGHNDSLRTVLRKQNTEKLQTSRRRLHATDQVAPHHAFAKASREAATRRQPCPKTANYALSPVIAADL